MTHQDEARGWLAYATDALKDAKISFDAGQYSVAVSLAYYAAFYAAKSVISLSRVRDPKTHTGVIGRFGRLAGA